MPRLRVSGSGGCGRSRAALSACQDNSLRRPRAVPYPADARSQGPDLPSADDPRGWPPRTYHFTSARLPAAEPRGSIRHRRRVWTFPARGRRCTLEHFPDGNIPPHVLRASSQVRPGALVSRPSARIAVWTS